MINANSLAHPLVKMENVILMENVCKDVSMITNTEINVHHVLQTALKVCVMRLENVLKDVKTINSKEMPVKMLVLPHVKILVSKMEHAWYLNQQLRQ